ncbi:MAG: hypothetical protein Crog4KO_36690 [Crocinitomicaceae bacterium]
MWLSASDPFAKKITWVTVIKAGGGGGQLDGGANSTIVPASVMINT